MRSWGKSSRSARTTVSPPSPESNTPSAASRCGRERSADSCPRPLRGFGWTVLFIRYPDPFGVSRASPMRVTPCHDALEHRHPNGDARFHLIENDAAAAVGDTRVDFDATVDRPGMHHDDIRLRQAEDSRVQPDGAGGLPR